MLGSAVLAIGSGACARDDKGMGITTTEKDVVVQITANIDITLLDCTLDKLVDAYRTVRM